MQTISRQQVLAETKATRNRATELLEALLQANNECERHVNRHQHPDSIKRLTGRSSMDNAIDSTRRMIDSLDRAIAEAAADLDDEDMGVLEEPDPVGSAQ